MNTRPVVTTDRQVNFSKFIVNLQTEVTETINHAETSKFISDQWQTSGSELSGHGTTMIMKHGNIIEQAGVNISFVSGTSLPTAASDTHNQLDRTPYEAMGLSLVIHPKNPFIPTAHANIRLILVKDPQNPDLITNWWLGGGLDLTPCYIYEDDIIHWHKTIKSACDPFGTSLYPRFKKSCDEYFYLPHRDETRGIGGIFFDHFNELPIDKSLAFAQSVGNAFLPAYMPILNARKDYVYSQFERDFQAYRRGRYVEFNLLYDRGTHFGLQSGFRTESVLMSMPPTVRFEYNYQTSTPKEQRLANYLKPRDWVS